MKDADLIIIGGGATGLTSALLAAKEGLSVLVVEGASTPGGLLSTFPLGPTRLEYFYHHFFTHDAEIRWLIEELGISERLRFIPGTMGIFRQGRHWDFNGPKDLLGFSPLSFFDKARFGVSSLYLGKFAKWETMEDVPALDWFRRYAGRQASESIWEPMLRIKFGPYAERVPVAWMVGRLRQRMSSRERGDERLGYLDGSLQSLLDALLAKLASLGVRILTGNPVASLLASQRRVEGVRLQDGTTLRSDRTLATLPTTRLVPLVEPLDAGYAESLRRIEYFGAVCTILELDRPLSQTYWLNVADPGFPFGGVIEHTNLISPEVYGGRHIAYLSRYYENSNPLATLPDAEVSRQMTEPLARIYGDGALKSILRTHVFRTQTAATVCDLGFSRKVPQVRSPLENLFIATMAHVYPDERSCNNSIRVAANACEVMGLNASAVPKGCSLSGLIGTAH